MARIKRYCGSYILEINGDKIKEHCGPYLYEIGGGRVKTAHGIIPVPAPAVVEILKNSNMIGGPVMSEIATPTGCAIYMELCDELVEFIPQIKVKKNRLWCRSKRF